MKSHIEIQIEHDDDGIHCGECKRKEPMFRGIGCSLFKRFSDITNLLTDSPTHLEPDTPLKGECAPTYKRCPACIDATKTQENVPL